MSHPHSLASHPIVLAFLTPFFVVFIWAAYLEIRRWYRHGPSRNQRANYDIDETAPSYEAPPNDRTRKNAKR